MKKLTKKKLKLENHVDTVNAVLESNILGPIPSIITSLFFKTFKNNVIYLPKHSRHSTKELKELGVAEIKIKTKDRTRISTGLYVSESNPDAPILIAFHGNGCSLLSHYRRMKPVIEDLNIHYYLISYRGFSGGRGHPDKPGMELDAVAGMDYLINHILGKKVSEKCQIFVHGASLGAAVACFLASREEYRGLVKGVLMDVPFSSIELFLQTEAPYSKDIAKYIVDGENWDNLKYFESIKAPVLMTGVLNDNVCRFWNFERLMEKAKKEGIDLTTLICEEGKHDGALKIKKNYDAYVKIWGEFLESKSS